MIDSRPEGGQAKASGGKSRWIQWGALGTVCALVIGSYLSMARSGAMESLCPSAADTYYNLLVQGFQAGQLSLMAEVPPGLAQLADPYDPTANAPYLSASYRVFDLSYYKGRFYLYFGVTPALILFWPVVAVTGHYLFQRQAVAIFCAVGFLAGVGLLCALRRRYFAEARVGVLAACALALGFASGVPVLLSRADVYEVPISCGYMLTMLALVAIWCALHEPERRCRWLAAASVAYGLAVGARPTLVLGAVILLLPVAQASRERRPVGALLMAAIVPILLIGLGLMLYNALRFGSPFEFGLCYQLAERPRDSWQRFSLRYLWFNFRVYFLESVGWSRHFPFVENMVSPPAPAGHGGVEQPFGILRNIPLVWMSLAVPLAWRNRSAVAGTPLRWFLTAVLLLFGIGALTLGLYYIICSRFEVDFLPPLVLLSVVGILGLERALSGQPLWQRAARWAWGWLLVFSVVFTLLVGAERRAQTDVNTGLVLVQVGRGQEAIGYFERALRIKSDYAEVHNILGVVLIQGGRLNDAVEHFERALRIKPEYADAHDNLGVALFQMGRVREAIGHYEEALRIKPDLAEAHYSLGLALEKAGDVAGAIGHFQAALRLKPDYAAAKSRLAQLRAAP